MCILRGERGKGPGLQPAVTASHPPLNLVVDNLLCVTRSRFRGEALIILSLFRPQ